MQKLLALIVALILFTLAGCADTPVESAKPAQNEIVVSEPSPTGAVETQAGSPYPAENADEVNQPEMASLEDEQFDLALAQAFSGFDFEYLRAAMRGQFALAIGVSELRGIEPEALINWLGKSYLVPGAAPQASFDRDVAVYLGGIDPLSIWGPVLNPARAFILGGLGPAANEEVVVVIGREAANGELYWLGIIVPEGGEYPQVTPVVGYYLETEVTYVVALQNINVRTIPTTGYEAVGMVRSGQIAQVTGVSADGNWWRIFCTNTTTNVCWISADPSLTEPTEAP